MQKSPSLPKIGRAPGTGHLRAPTGDISRNPGSFPYLHTHACNDSGSIAIYVTLMAIEVCTLPSFRLEMGARVSLGCLSKPSTEKIKTLQCQYTVAECLW